MVMDEMKKKTLDLPEKHRYLAFQGVCLPLAVILSDSRYKNWYYLNYMNPVVRLDGINNLKCDITDCFVYGAGANIYSKIVRNSSVNIDVCQQIQDIVKLLKSHIDKEYYCILFLDFYYLKCSKFYQVKHCTHELMIYGYDDFSLTFKCYGYMNTQYRYIKLSYEEIEKGFINALEYINNSNGWEEYMFMTLQKVEHKLDYPYSNRLFVNKLNCYINGEISDITEYESLLYLNKTETTIVAAGIFITDVMCKYIELLEDSFSCDVLYENFVNQLSAINMYEFYHAEMFEKIKYFAMINGFEKQLIQQVNKYHSEVVKKCSIVRMLYLKLIQQIDEKLSVSKTLQDMEHNLKMIKLNEENILCCIRNIITNLICSSDRHIN